MKLHVLFLSTRHITKIGLLAFRPVDLEEHAYFLCIKYL